MLFCTRKFSWYCQEYGQWSVIGILQYSNNVLLLIQHLTLIQYCRISIRQGKYRFLDRISSGKIIFQRSKYQYRKNMLNTNKEVNLSTLSFSVGRIFQSYIMRLIRNTVIPICFYLLSDFNIHNATFTVVIMLDVNNFVLLYTKKLIF